jgi:predicted amidohydrolase
MAEVWTGSYRLDVADLLRVACVQVNAGDDKAANLEKVEKLVGRAAATGADLVVLPEKWNAIGSPDVFRASAERVDSGETFGAMSGWAARHGITLVGGSVTELREGREKLSNTCAVYDPGGELVALYRKIHMFDVDVGGQSYRESEAEEAGDEVVACEAEGWRVGLTICYDLRFPELWRILALDGAELITAPAAFTLFTGKDHWELLLRARAVENQLYVAAANQWGSFAPGKACYGRSLIADPWGVVVAAAPDEDCVVSAELERSRIDRIRQSLPSLANRQPAAYRWPAEV